MGICWFCHWGWPKAINNIYMKAVEKLNGDSIPLNFGPAHIVWEDENFDSAQWCLDNFSDYDKNLSDEEKAIVRWSLEELLKLPKEIINAQPEDYDDEHPEKYPPPKHIEWSRKGSV